ncbi:centrosomal protein of 152 kDa isoform X3 [Corythoichthys intestinalis]|uniref:centrosomal protein of 152 kDa isoform X3 n=1 Tax=Corythoichthys intestinalis TaxID=161448 RepID=UPI0025A5B877|nr:centrosomal protein of 152 kDa isoform X3 [Corythoichthys intestinalis]
MFNIDPRENLTRVFPKASAVMSLDFDGAAFQTQDEDEQYDQNDIDRDQELRQLIVEMPDDDMLEDSRESSCTEQEYSPICNKNASNSPQSKRNQHGSNRPLPTSNEQNYGENYIQLPRGFAHENGGVEINGHQRHAQTQLWAQMCNQQPLDTQFAQEDCTRTSIGSENSGEVNGFYTNEPYGSKPHLRALNVVNHNEETTGDKYDNGNYKNPRDHFHSGAVERHVTDHKLISNPQISPHQKLSSLATHRHYPYDQLQRELLDSTQQTAEKEELAQQRTVNQAYRNNVVELEQKLEDSKRNIRELEHKLGILKNEKASSDANVKELSCQLAKAKKQEVQMENKIKANEQIIWTLKESDREKTKELGLAKDLADSLNQQILELRRSETLSKPRERHDRDITVIREQHEATLLVLQQQLDAKSQALDEQMDCNKRYQQQVKQLEQQREEEQLKRADVVNALNQRLEESQRQCATLLQTSSVLEINQLKINLNQVKKAKEISENMNKVLLEDMDQLKEEITRYESALNHGLITLDGKGDCENQLTESCLDLGFKKTTLTNGSLHRMALANLSDSNLPKDALLREEVQRCLMCLKAKRQKISNLKEQLQQSQIRVNELETELEEAKLGLSVVQSSQIKQPNRTEGDQNEFTKLQENTRLLQDKVEMLKKEIQQRKQSEENLQSNYKQLCHKMKEIQETAKRSEQINQQHMDDVVNQVKRELMMNHDAQVEHLTTQYEQRIHQLNIQLSEARHEISAVQKEYMSMCKERDSLENEQKKQEEGSADLEKLRSELEMQHQASVTQLKTVWSMEKEAEIRRHVASAKAAWDEEHHQTWTLKLKEARHEKHLETSEGACQTDETQVNCMTITTEELDAKLRIQRNQLQMEADKVQRQAVEEARKQTLKETQEKHLEDLAVKVEDAVTRAYDRWIEDLTSLPEYQASLQREREKWEQLQKQSLEEKIWQPLIAVEQHETLLGQNCGTVEELQAKLVTLQRQLDHLRREQDALLKAELAGARAAWKRDKQKEISALQTRSEELYQRKLQEECKKMELALLQARDNADAQRKELLLQMEAELQQTISAREDKWKHQQAESEQAQRQQMREDFLAELQAGLAEVQAQLLGSSGTVEGDGNRLSEGAVKHLIQTCCVDIVDRAVSQAKKDWKKISEAQLSCVLRETQQRHEREISEMQSSLAQMGGQACGSKECMDTTSKLKKDNQELQKRLEKACRHLQHSVLENKKTVQKLKDEHESRFQKAKSEHLLQLEEVRRSEAAGTLNHQQNLQSGLEEMQQQYMKTVERIRGDTLRYLRESRDRAAELIRNEVQKERKDTARKMRHYYLTCLQELLEDGGKTTGAEKIIMNAASKLATMAKVLETPMKNKSGKNHTLPTQMAVASTTGPSLISHNSLRNPLTKAHDVITEDRKTTLARTKFVSKQNIGTGETSKDAQIYPQKAATITRSKQEFPVRDDKCTDWSLTTSDSDSVHITRASFSGRKVESVKPFSISATDFGGLSPNASDLTVYNDIAQETKTQQQTFAPEAKMSSHREPTPGSEGDKRRMAFTKPPLLELIQQDSGFDSPFNHPKCQ